MAVVIPEAYHRLLERMLVTQDAQCCRGEEEIACFLCWHAQPSRCQNTEKVAVAKDQDIALYPSHSCYHPVGAHAYLHCRFALWTAISEDIPAQMLPTNLHGSLPFVL